jgi:hypothetical protein
VNENKQLETQIKNVNELKDINKKEAQISQDLSQKHKQL